MRSASGSCLWLLQDAIKTIFQGGKQLYLLRRVQHHPGDSIHCEKLVLVHLSSNGPDQHLWGTRTQHKYSLGFLIWWNGLIPARQAEDLCSLQHTHDMTILVARFARLPDLQITLVLRHFTEVQGIVQTLIDAETLVSLHSGKNMYLSILLCHPKVWPGHVWTEECQLAGLHDLWSQCK